MDHLETTINYLLENRIKTRQALAAAKRKIAKKHKIACPNNISLLKTYHKLLKKKKIKKSLLLENLLITRPVRSLSGIVNVSVLTKPYPCPGKCIFCPIEKGIPKSYVSGEPAVERAKKLNFDPYLQVKKRIEMLELEGHPTDKVEIRIVGGTWSHYPKKYQNWFIKECFRATNKNSKRQLKTKSLKEEQKRNEKAKYRIVGLSVETRPDFINPKEIRRLRKLGVTMVELGIQTIYDHILKLNSRGHKVKETILATKLLKEAGFKVLYQMMPDLLGSNLEKDKEMFKELFSNSDFQPDLLKIYPCALLKEAPLYRLWKKKKYKPYSKEELISLVKAIKKIIPYYVRIQRISRDIPSFLIPAGPAKISNLRQILDKTKEKENWLCRCIRCREIRGNYKPKEKIYLFRQDYQASQGYEIFLSFENKERTKLYSLLRLRIPGFFFKKNKAVLKPAFPTLRNSALIREIHTYGQVQSLNSQTRKISVQHKGLGKGLIKQAEKISQEEFKINKISIIAAIGARDYFRKLGYKLKDTYMVKKI